MDYHFLETMLIFVLYGWSSIPLIYLMSFLFSESTSAYIKLILFNYISGTYSILIEQLLSGGKYKNFTKSPPLKKRAVNK